MKILGATSSLPVPRNPSINCQFSYKDIKDYYVPNDQHILFRYVLLHFCLSLMYFEFSRLRFEAFPCRDHRIRICIAMHP